MKRQFLLSTFLLLLSLVSVGLGLPVDVSQDTTLKVSQNGTTLFEVEPLADEALSSLKAWLKSPPASAKVSSVDGVIKGLPVNLVVSSSIAAKWNSEPKALAQMFAQKLNGALGNSSPQWSVDGQVVPLGESRVVKLHPALGVTVVSSDPDVFDVEDLGGGSYRVTGKKWARATLIATTDRGGSIPELPVSVKPWAARWENGPGRLTFWGTVNDQRVERSLRRWLSARTLNGADISLERLKSEGDSSRVYLAKASAQGAIGVEEKLTIALSEKPPQVLRPAEVVVLSNHPERIVSDGILFQRNVEGAPFRFMWHHRNDPEGPDRYLVLQLTNHATAPRKLRALWYSYGPSPDEIHVGHTAALDYSVAGATGLGEEITLPAGGTRTIEIRRVKAGQTMSGMAYLDDADTVSGSLGITVLATSNLELPIQPAASRDPGRTASGVFKASIISNATHLVGGPFTYLQFGGEPYEKDIVEGHPSYGNFGTVYRTALVLKNPTDIEKEVSVGFASGGGAARGVLNLDGEIFNLPMGTTGDGVPVKKYMLAPGEIRQVDVELFPQAGSNYPVRVVVKSDFERRAGESVEPLRPIRPYIP